MYVPDKPFKHVEKAHQNSPNNLQNIEWSHNAASSRSPFFLLISQKIFTLEDSQRVLTLSTCPSSTTYVVAIIYLAYMDVRRDRDVATVISFHGEEGTHAPNFCTFLRSTCHRVIVTICT